MASNAIQNERITRERNELAKADGRKTALVGEITQNLNLLGTDELEAVALLVEKVSEWRG